MGRFLKFCFLGALIIGAAAGGAYMKLGQWADAARPVSDEVIIDFKARTSLASLAEELERSGVVSNALMFHAYVRLMTDYRKFQAGKYRFTGMISPKDVVDTIRKGDTYNPIVLQYTIPEGFTVKNIVERLAANGVGHIVELRRLVRDDAFLKSLGIPGPSLEGYLYPATYSFHEMPTARQALEQMVQTFWQNLPKDYEKNVNALGLSLYQAVTFASLIELETMLDDEKPLISEVIWRRLKDKVPLGIDATIIYGIPDYNGDLKWVHLSDAKNPYNTRVHRGLPPTPIGSPGRKSLEAVLTPTDYGYYYYVLMPEGGRHQFSKSLKEHNAHVKKYVEATKRKKKSKVSVNE